MRAPDPLADEHRAASGDARGDRRVRVLVVTPPDELDRVGGRRLLRERQLQRRHDQRRRAIDGDHEHGRSFQRHRLVADQIPKVRRGRDHDGGSARVPEPGRCVAQPTAVVRRQHRQTFNRICCGTIWKVTGVVPRRWPSATTGRVRRDVISICSLACTSVIDGSGTWSPCRKIRGSNRYAFDFGPVNTSPSSTPSPGNDRGDNRIPPSVNWPLPITMLHAWSSRVRRSVPIVTGATRVRTYARQNAANRFRLSNRGPPRDAAIVAAAWNPISATLCAYRIVRAPSRPVTAIFIRSNGYVSAPARWPIARSVSPGSPKLSGRSDLDPAATIPSTGDSTMGRPSRNIPFTTAWKVASSPTAARNRYPSSSADALRRRRSSGDAATWSRYSSPRASRACSTAPTSRATTPCPARGSSSTASGPNGLVVGLMGRSS